MENKKGKKRLGYTSDLGLKVVKEEGKPKSKPKKESQ